MGLAHTFVNASLVLMFVGIAVFFIDLIVEGLILQRKPGLIANGAICSLGVALILAVIGFVIGMVSLAT